METRRRSHEVGRVIWNGESRGAGCGEQYDLNIVFTAKDIKKKDIIMDILIKVTYPVINLNP